MNDELKLRVARLEDILYKVIDSLEDLYIAQDIHGEYESKRFLIEQLTNARLKLENNNLTDWE